MSIEVSSRKYSLEFKASVMEMICHVSNFSKTYPPKLVA